MDQKHKYVYDGPVKVFDTIVAERWHGETYAFSKEKAKSNMTYQYKKSHNLVAATKVTLTGNVVMVGYERRDNRG